MRLLDQQLSVEKLLRAYRARLASGVYFFVGRVQEGELQGIEEISVRPAMKQPLGDGDGVVFGFIERGWDPHAGPGAPQQYPLVHHVQATTPEFMKKLQEYLEERVRTE